MITFEIEDADGKRREVEVPADINLSLMEVLKASDYNILATCGGMALCATCHVEIREGSPALGEPSDIELDMIDTLPDATANSRLACQIKISPALQGMCFALKETSERRSG